MPSSYRPQNLGGIANSGIYSRPTSPDYSSALDSITSAFQNNRDAIIRRAIMQQRADAARASQVREDAALRVSQGHLELAQHEAANKLIEGGHDEVDPSVPHLGPDGKPVPVTMIGQRGFVLNPARTPAALKKVQEDADREEMKKNLLSAGADANRVDALLDNPSAAADFLRTPHDLHSRIQSRIQELTSGGMPIDKANAQARLELGEAPRAVGRASTTSSRNPATAASQRERFLNGVADRAIQASNGDVNKAGEALLQQPETANIFNEGLNATHLNAAATRYRNRTAGRGGGAAPSRPSKGVLGDLVAGGPGAVPPNQPSLIRVPKNLPTTGAQASQQQRDWDEAAAVLRNQKKDPTTVIGARPPR